MFIVDWVEESHKVAVDVAEAGVKENMGLREDYLNTTQAALDHQLGAAGLRLASILNGIFDPK
jgi:S1/P1 Nuclease